LRTLLNQLPEACKGKVDKSIVCIYSGIKSFDAYIRIFISLQYPCACSKAAGKVFYGGVSEKRINQEETAGAF
jgi:hypothetical protein